LATAHYLCIALLLLLLSRGSGHHGAGADGDFCRMAGSPAWPRRWRSTNLAAADSIASSRTSAYHAYSPNMLLSGSRDKTLIIWNLTRDETQYGYPKRSLHGHSHIVSDCVCFSGGTAPSKADAGSVLLIGLAGDLVGRRLRSLCLVGQDSPPLGALHWHHHPPFRWPHQRCPLRLVLRRQPPDRFRLARPEHQAVEHPR